MSPDLFDNEHLQAIIREYGIEYAVMSYCSGQAIEDQKLARIWDKTAESILQIKSILFNEEE